MGNRKRSEAFYEQVKEITGNKEIYAQKVSNLLDISDIPSFHYNFWDDVDNYYKKTLIKDISEVTGKKIKHKPTPRHKYSSIKELHEMVLKIEGDAGKKNMPAPFIYDTLLPFIYALGIDPFFDKIKELQKTELFTENIKNFLALIFFIICEEKNRELYNYILEPNKETEYHAKEIFKMKKIYEFIFDICKEKSWEDVLLSMKQSRTFLNHCDREILLTSQNNAAASYSFHKYINLIPPIYRNFLYDKYQNSIDKLLSHFSSILYNITGTIKDNNISLLYVCIIDFITDNNLNFLFDRKLIIKIIDNLNNNEKYNKICNTTKTLKRINKTYISNIKKLRSIELNCLLEYTKDSLSEYQLSLLENNYSNLLFNFFIKDTFEVKTEEEVLSFYELKNLDNFYVPSDEDIVFSLNSQKQIYLNKFNKLSDEQKEIIYNKIDSLLQDQ